MQQLNAVQTLVGRQQDQGQRQAGTTRVSELKVQSVNLDNSDPDAGKVPTVVIDVCWDVSKVDVLDKDGKSIVCPNRPDTGWTRYTSRTTTSPPTRAAAGESRRAKTSRRRHAQPPDSPSSCRPGSDLPDPAILGARDCIRGHDVRADRPGNGQCLI